jgi:hypothetical protein
MDPVIGNILNDFSGETVLMNAIVTNNAMIYTYLSEILIHENSSFKDVEHREGKAVTDQALIDVLTIFRRQVKYGKINIQCRSKQITVNNRVELSAYLKSLFVLIVATGPSNPLHPDARELEEKLIKGIGFQQLYDFKRSVLNSLYGFGCLEPDDQEEIFHESLIVFWKKLINRELGIYLTGNASKPDHFRVYNRRFFQESKAITFITGIAKNLFFNKIKRADYKNYDVSKSQVSGHEEQEMPGETENPVIIQFLYYRNFVEQRKLRTIVSILQYDCNLEDNEVKMLIGINNARIHSSRLRTHFFEWYRENKDRLPFVHDLAREYFIRRDLKSEALNKKARTIDYYQRNIIKTFDLGIFREEFRTLPEYTRNYQVFKYVLYFTAMGKYSALKGLPNEKIMRLLMQSYKQGLFSLPKYQIMLILLFYGSDEPGEVLVDLLNAFHSEKYDPVSPDESGREQAVQPDFFNFRDKDGLTNEIYHSNCNLFSHFSDEKSFLNLMKEHGIV